MGLSRVRGPSPVTDALGMYQRMEEITFIPSGPPALPPVSEPKMAPVQGILSRPPSPMWYRKQTLMTFGSLRVATSPKCLFMMTASYLRECVGEALEPTLKPPGTLFARRSGSENLGSVCQPGVPWSGSKERTIDRTLIGDTGGTGGWRWEYEAPFRSAFILQNVL